MSYNFGAGNKERVKKAFFTQFKVCTIFTSCFWLIMLLFPKLFAGIFSNNTDLIMLSFVLKSLTKRLIRLILSVNWLTFANQRKWLNSADSRR